MRPGKKAFQKELCSLSATSLLTDIEIDFADVLQLLTIKNSTNHAVLAIFLQILVQAEVGQTSAVQMRSLTATYATFSWSAKN